MNELKMLTQEEVSELLNTSKDTVTMLREVGIIKATKTGRNYMFSQEEIKKMQVDYKGLDVSNRVKALESYRIVNS